MGLTWSAVRMERACWQMRRSPRGEDDPGAWRGATGRVEADEGEGRVSGRSGTGIRDSRRVVGKRRSEYEWRSSLVFLELRRVTCGVVVHKGVDNYRGVRITGGILWTRCGQEKNLK